MKSEDTVEVKVMDNGYVIYVNKWDDEGKRKAMVFLDVEDALAYVAKVLRGELS
ncbi:MAG: hypothetical protein WC503_03070 [Candidatus Shapirobacteria bacterium]